MSRPNVMSDFCPWVTFEHGCIFFLLSPNEDTFSTSEWVFISLVIIKYIIALWHLCDTVVPSGFTILYTFIKVIQFLTDDFLSMWRFSFLHT